MYIRKMNNNTNDPQNESREELLQRIAELEQELASIKKGYAETDMAVDLDSARILKEKYEKMRQANKSFSIRALAKKVKISSGKISDIFNGRYILSRELAQRIIQNLDFGETLEKEFLAVVDQENSRQEAYRDFVRQNLDRERIFAKKSKEIGHLENIELIDDWMCYGLMAALGVSDSQHSISWLADKFKSPESIILKNLEKLMRMNLVEKKGNLYFSMEEQTINNSMAAGTKASKIAADRCSVSAFRYLAQRLESDIDNDLDSEDRANKTYCFITALEPEKIGNVPEFLGHGMWTAVQDMAGPEAKQLYMMMMSFRKI
jgi:uncharacterized protein (TIGR02147 family)